MLRAPLKVEEPSGDEVEVAEVFVIAAPDTPDSPAQTAAAQRTPRSDPLRLRGNCLTRPVLSQLSALLDCCCLWPVWRWADGSASRQAYWSMND